jgi:integrase
VCARWEDVDLAGGVIRVRRGWDRVAGEIAPKSRHAIRRVPIAAVLRDYLLERKLVSDGIYALGGDPQTRRMATRGAEAMRTAGIEPLAIHDCRHTYASVMIAALTDATAAAHPAQTSL